MNMFDPLDPMNPFFQDKFIFYDENDQQRQSRNGDDFSRQPCPDCGEMLEFHPDAETVRCRHCGGRFRVN